VVFSQLYVNDTYEPSSSFAITGASASMNNTYVGYYSHAAPFYLESDTLLSSVDLALSFYPESSSTSVKVSIRLSSSLTDLPTGEPITSGFVMGLPNDSSSSTLTSFIPGGAPILLSAGQTYWITAEPTDAFTFNGWNQIKNNLFEIWPIPFPGRSRLAVSNDGVDYTERLSGALPAFQVTGTTIPEPSSAFLSLISMILLSLRRIRTRCEWQPAIASFIESELDVAGATTHRSLQK
jgi:hypothetical protein